MLPFGSLFTQLPLLAIGILYVIYLGLSAVNKEKTGLSKEIKQPKLQIMETGETVDFFTLATMSFHSSADKQEPFFVVPSNCFAQSFVFPDKNFQISSFYDIHILSRPPPKS